jgi:hypothetical protein
MLAPPRELSINMMDLNVNVGMDPLHIAARSGAQSAV